MLVVRSGGKDETKVRLTLHGTSEQTNEKKAREKKRERNLTEHHTIDTYTYTHTYTHTCNAQIASQAYWNGRRDFTNGN